MKVLPFFFPWCRLFAMCNWYVGFNDLFTSSRFVRDFQMKILLHSMIECLKWSYSSYICFQLGVSIVNGLASVQETLCVLEVVMNFHFYSHGSFCLISKFLLSTWHPWTNEWHHCKWINTDICPNLKNNFASYSSLFFYFIRNYR